MNFEFSAHIGKKKIISLISKYSLQDAVKWLPFFFSDTGLLLTTARRNKIRKEFIKKTYRQASTYLAKTFLLSQAYGQEFNRCFPLSVLNCVLLHITLRYSPLLHLLSLYVHWTSILHCFFPHVETDYLILEQFWCHEKGIKMRVLISM